MDNTLITDQQIISADSIPESTPTNANIVFNMYDEPPTTVPLADDILDKIIEILECMSTPEMKLLKSTNVDLFESVMEEKFPKFADDSYATFKMILSGEDLTPMFKMLSMIKQVNKGNSTYEDAEATVGKYLGNRFLPKELLQPPQSTQTKSTQKKTKNKRK